MARTHATTLLAIVCGVVAVAQSWFRWLHPTIDAGRDLYIPKQLAHGARLYADILYFYPPLVPWLLSWWPARSLAGYAVFGGVIALLTAVVIFVVVRRTSGDMAAGAALLLFLTLSVCGTGGWGANYFFPYAHAATAGMLLFVAGAALFRWSQPESGAFLLLAAAWTKIEFAVFGLAVMLLVVLFAGAGDERVVRRRRFASAAVYLLLLVASTAAVLAHPLWRANIFPPSLLSTPEAQFFYAHVSGAAAWRTNLLLAIRGALLVGVGVVILRYFERSRVIVSVAMVVIGLLLANPTFFQAWTILQLALVPFAIREPRSRLAFLLLLSAAGCSRIWLNLSPAWYGFVFTVPLQMLIAYTLFAWLPELGVYSRRASMLWLPAFIAVAISGLFAARAAYGDAVAVSTPRGTYYDPSRARGAAVSSLIEHLQRVEARELVVMPEGLGVNFLSGVRSPARFHTFTPIELAGSERAALLDLTRVRPERIAIVPRDVSEFGYRGFGVDYGREIAAWIRSEYEPEARFGEILLLRERARSLRR